MGQVHADITLPHPIMPPDPLIRDVACYYAQKYGATVLAVAGKEVPTVLTAADKEVSRHWFYFAEKPFEQQPWDVATGFAFVCGKNGYRCVDIDLCRPEWIPHVAEAILNALQLPKDYPWQVLTTTGFHLWFRTADQPKPFPQAVGEWKPWGKFEHAFHHLELRYANAYALVPPSLHPSGLRYAFREGTAPDQPPAEVDFIALTNALCQVSYYDDGICGGCYQSYEGCICGEREERESEYGYWD